MFLKRHVVNKDGKEHVYYSLCESVRVNRKRVMQRRVLHLGELTESQVDSWERTIQIVQEDGGRKQLRLFVDRPGVKIPAEEDVAEVILSSLSLRNARRFGDCWLGSRLWSELRLDVFWSKLLSDERGAVPWVKVVELLSVNRLLDPRSELFVHEKWYRQTAMGFLLNTNDSVAGKDRVYRVLDRIVKHKDALEAHLKERWSNLFNARYDILLYDLTSTYFEGQAKGVAKAKRGYSRDHRPDCKQIVVALIVSADGFPVTYEIFDGNRNDVTTLEAMLSEIERKYGQANRIWVFDRGIVSEENLATLRKRGCRYLVGTPRNALKAYEAKLVDAQWTEVSTEVKVQLLAETEETYVLAKSTSRAEKEHAMRKRVVCGLMRELIRLKRAIKAGRLKDSGKIHQRLGRLSARYVQAWKFVTIDFKDGALSWKWDREMLRVAHLTDGAYLLRTNLTEQDPAKLWKQYMQLTDVEAAFRTIKSEIGIRPIWHHKGSRVEAHVMVAFLGYCLWVCLKHKLQAKAPSLTPWQAIELLKPIQLIEVWFRLRAGGSICLERITQPDPAQKVLLAQLGWQLPAQPPPRVYQADSRLCGQLTH